MSIFYVAIIILALVLVQGIGLWLMAKRQEKRESESLSKSLAPEDDRGLMLLQNQIEKLERALDMRMAESQRSVHETMRTQNEQQRSATSETANLIREITQEITSVKEIGRQTQGFAEQLQSLQDVLKNPKQRGILGEYYLETTLKNVLPPDGYQMQYPFSNGEIVDAAVFVNGKVVPIDSKFSLDNYNRLVKCEPSERAAFEKAFVNDLKLRITETAKYIRPEENTMDFAFMFIPSEGIYYDLLTNTVGAAEDENLLQRAASKHKVIIVSPTSFLAYLQTVLLGLNALKIEKRAEEIQKRVGELGKHLGAYEDYYKKLGNSLSTSVSHYNAGYKELGKVEKDVYRITAEKMGLDVLTIEKPGMEELD